MEPVLGPHARTDCTRNTRVAVPQLPAAEDGRSGEGQRLTPDAPHNGGRPPPPGDGPPPPPRHAAPTGRAGQGDSVRPPHPHSRAHRTWVADPNSRPSTQQSGEGERLTSDAPRNGGRHPPRGCPSASPAASKAGPQGARCGACAGSPRPHRPHLEHTGRGTPAARRRGRAAGGETAPDTRRPSQRWQATPPPGTAPPHPRGTQPPKGVQAKPGREEPGPDRPPPSTPDGARDRGRTCGGARTTWNGPTSAQCRDRASCARHTTQGGGGRRGCTSAHTQKGHAATTRKATGPSSRNAQTGWNGVPASEGKGHPDRTARHTQRRTRGAGRGKRERHNTRYRPEPPKQAASAAHTRTGHCTRQGSSGALRHAPTPRQGSLRASPRGSHWRQASSMGPAAPAPRATTHYGGDTVGKRPQPRLRIDALTREWRNGETGEGRGSEPCEPGRLRHQAGGASWRALH